MVQSTGLTVKNKLIAIIGATASGKSSFAIDLAKRIDGEIISCDSMQVYKGLDIGTAKVSMQERAQVPHHLIDIIEPHEQFSAAQFAALAKQKIEQIESRNKRVILVGGTGLFLKGLLYNHSFGQAHSDQSIRQEIESFIDKNGLQKAHQYLSEIDSASAQKIHVNDRVRIVRAIEIFKLNGKPKSQINELDLNLSTPSVIIGLDFDRQLLYDRINSRVDAMIEDGLVDEVKSLLRFKDCNSMRAIGYKELVAFIEGQCSLDEAINKIKQASRNYAKRQLTYFRAMKEIVWVDAQKSFEQNYQEIMELCHA